MTKDKQRYIHFAIMFLLTIGISLCPPFGQITPYGMKALGVFVGVLYGWIFIDLIWPSIFGFAALGLSGLTTITQALSLGFGNQMLLLMMFILIFCGALDAAGLTDFLSTWLLQRKIFRKNPWTLIIGIFLIGYIVGTFGPGLAAIFLLWSIVLRIAALCGIDEKDPLIAYLLFSIFVITNTGGFVLPFHSAPVIFMGFLSQSGDFSIPYVPFIVFAFVITMLLNILLILFGKYVLRLDASRFVLPDEIAAEIEGREFSKKQIASFVVLICYITALLLPELIPSLPGMKLLSSIGLLGITVIALLIMSFISIEKEPLIDLTTVFSKHTQWPLLLLLAVTFPLAEVIKAQDAGIMATITKAIGPIVSNMGLVPFLIFTVLVLGVLTQVTHNLVLGAMFIPFLVPLGVELGGNAATIWFMIFFTLQAAYVTPAASGQAAMVHGNEAMSKKYAYLLGLVWLVLHWIILIGVGIPLGSILFP